MWVGGARGLPAVSSRKLTSLQDSLQGSPVKLGTIPRRFAWPLRKDDAHKSRSGSIVYKLASPQESHSHGLRQGV